MTTSATPDTHPHEHDDDQRAHRPVAASPTHAESEDQPQAEDPHAVPAS